MQAVYLMCLLDSSLFMTSYMYRAARFVSYINSSFFQLKVFTDLPLDLIMEALAGKQ